VSRCSPADGPNRQPSASPDALPTPESRDGVGGADDQDPELAAVMPPAGDLTICCRPPAPLPGAGEFGNPGGMAESEWIGIAVMAMVGIAVLGAFTVLAKHRGRSRRREEPSLAEALASPGATLRPGSPKLSEEDAGPYPGSARPGPDGAPPSDRFVIKAEEAGKVYYAPAAPEFARVHADVWFLDAGEAESAGFHPAASRAR
jgi:hypothetical protein